MKENQIVNRTAAISLFSIFLAGIAALAATPKAGVRLSLDETSVLPATPTGVEILVTNPTGQELQLPTSVWLVATNDVGQTFTVRAFSVSQESPSKEIPEALRVLPPGAAREFRYEPVVGVIGSPWLMDDRLWAPGRYRLRAVLAPDVKRDGTFDPATALVSDEVTLTVALRTQDDATAWKWMQEQKWSEMKWMAGGLLWQFLQKHHLKTEYELFVAAYTPRQENSEPNAFVDELIKRYPNRSFTDQIKLMVIPEYREASSLAFRRSDPTRGIADAEEARALASELLEQSRSSNVRAEAKNYLDHIPTREQLLKKPETR